MGHDHLIGDTGTDIRNGDIGFDYARYDTALTGVVSILRTLPRIPTMRAGDSYLSVEGLVGSDFNDTLSSDNIVMISTSSHCRTAPRSIQNDFLFVCTKYLFVCVHKIPHLFKQNTLFV